MTSPARVVAMLSPVLFVIVGLFGLGFATVFVQSLGIGVPGAAASPTAAPTLQHYGDLARSAEFYRSLGLTVWVATMATTVAVVGGVALALLLDAVVRGRRLVRSKRLPGRAVGAAQDRCRTLVVTRDTSVHSRRSRTHCSRCRWRCRTWRWRW
jgi:hypothetical protein